MAGDAGVYPSINVLASDDNAYRYLLHLQLSDAPGRLMMIIHNPSLDDTEADPTTARCMELASAWGYGALYIGARFARRSADAESLWSQPGPNDPMAFAILRETAISIDASARAEWTEDGDSWAGVVICWGSLTVDSDAAITTTSLTTATLMRSLGFLEIELDTLGTNDETDGAPKSVHDVVGDVVERVPYGG